MRTEHIVQARPVQDPHALTDAAESQLACQAVVPEVIALSGAASNGGDAAGSTGLNFSSMASWRWVGGAADSIGAAAVSLDSNEVEATGPAAPESASETECGAKLGPVSAGAISVSCGCGSTGPSKRGVGDSVWIIPRGTSRPEWPARNC
ncbi:MAG: hypothetical protein KME20_27465 [Kaiparowitsia implicata GSE-PSE-MK54-09C]|nr:hypothetical protein [Kaiparowitsia implicata GSE-PSE-MK54-09C]